MKEQAIQKINKIGKISSIIALIAKILVGIALVATLAGAVVCFALPKSLMNISMESEMIMEMDLSSIGVNISEEERAMMQENMRLEMNGEASEFTEVELSGNTMTMRGDFERFTISMKDIGGFLILAFVTLTMTFITLVFVGGLCKAFRDCKTPFEEMVIKKMQHFAYALIPWTITATISNSLSDSLMNQKISLNFTLDLGIILVVLVVLVLVHIFKYGAVLQQESDETL